MQEYPIDVQRELSIAEASDFREYNASLVDKSNVLSGHDFRIAKRKLQRHGK